jgi:hypothetical protein
MLMDAGLSVRIVKSGTRYPFLELFNFAKLTGSQCYVSLKSEELASF